MFTLYTVPTANGQRASIALEECEIEYAIRHVDFAKGEHRSPEVLAVNPLGRLPVLVDNAPERIVYGSMAIVREAARLSGRLLPAPNLETAADHWSGILMTDLSPSFASQFHLGVLAPERFDWGLQYYGEVIDRILRNVESHLSENEYFLGAEYSYVDVLMYPTAATSATRLPDGLNPYPALLRWRDQVGARPAVQRGMEASGTM
jgi:GST-like protein